MFLTPVAVTCNRLRENGVDVTIKYPLNSGTQTYLEQIGFPKGSEKPSEDYTNHLPLCLLNTKTERDAIEIAGQKIREILNRQFSNLPAGAIIGIHYPIGEIIDNVDSHSACDHGALLVQNYPSKPFLDICVADDGVSIPGSFEKHGIDFSDTQDALRKALFESVSTKQDFGHDRGYGLRTTTKMICDGLDGNVLLSSRDSTLVTDSQTTTEIAKGFTWSGTVFGARLYLPETSFEWTEYVE